MRRKDPWRENLQVLDLSVQASWQEVQARYRQLVLRYHPDVNPSKQSSYLFRQIAEAYETLASLRKEQKARSSEELARMSEDPRVRRLSPAELEMRLLYSTSPELRAAAAYLLGKWNGKESRRVLLKAIRDRDVFVRQVALKALGDIGRPGDMFRLMALLFEREPGTMKMSLASVVRIWLRSLKGVSPLNRFSRWQEESTEQSAREERT